MRGWLLTTMRRRRVSMLAVFLLLALIALNVLAYQHAYAMTHFKAEDQASARPEPASLSLYDKVGLLFRGVSLGRPQSDVTPAAGGLGYEALTIAGRRGGLAAWVVPHEQPRGVVLIFHGYASCKANLLAEAKAFHDLGYTCLLVDFPGSGDSAGVATTIGYREADDVRTCVAEAERRWPGTPLILFGQSMGAAAVLKAMNDAGPDEQRRIEAVILECPFDRMKTAVRARFRTVGVPAFPAAELMLFWGSVQHRFNTFAHNPVEYARGVRRPVLVMHGSADPRVSEQEVAEVYGNLPGEEKQLHTFKGLGHESYVSRRAEEWKKAVREFLERR